MVRLYRALLWLFPPGFRAEHGRDALETFDELMRRSSGRSRLWLAVRAFARIPTAALAERLDERRFEPPQQRHNNKGGRVDRWIRHLKYGARTLWKAPSFTWSAVLLVGLGVGSATTIFSLADHLVLRPLPYPAPERLITPENGSHSGPLFRGMQELNGFEDWAGAFNRDVNLTSEDHPQRIEEGRVTESFFSMLGGRAIRGRLLTDDDYTSLDVAVVSEGAWRRIWGSDPDLLDSTIVIDGSPVTVVGILADEFSPPEPIVGRSIDIWRPVDWEGELLTGHGFWILEVIGRMQAGVTVADAQAEMDGLMDRMAPVDENYRERDSDAGRRLPVVLLSEAIAGRFRAGLGLLFGAVGLLLLVACANVAHLFLARGLGRQREMAVRRALGADTSTLVGQLMAESMLVGLVGGAFGVLFANVGLRAFLAVSPYPLPRDVSVSLDARVLAFAVALAGLTALAFGLLPALRSVRRDPGNELKGAARTATDGRGAGALRNGLLVAEVALSLVLVTSAGLLLRSFFQVQNQDPGFNLASVWTMPLTPREVETPEEYVLAMEEVRQALEARPEVAVAAYGLTMPLEHTGGGRCCWRTSISTADESVDIAPTMHPVSVEYFDALQIPIEVGRSWTVGETGTDPIPVVASTSFATETFGGTQEAINQVVQSRSTSYLIIGTVGDVRHYGLDDDHGPALYLPMERVPFALDIAHMAVRLRSEAGPEVAQGLRAAIWSAQPNLPVPVVRPMKEWMKRGNAERQFDALIFGAFGLIALVLAAGGLYGTLLYVTGQRHRELAIRLALGATSGKIERWVLRGGIGLAVVGVLVGIGGSWIATRLLENRLFGVERGDPLALVGAAALLLLAAAFASWLPARRAGRTDPLEMLKAE